VHPWGNQTGWALRCGKRRVAPFQMLGLVVMAVVMAQPAFFSSLTIKYSSLCPGKYLFRTLSISEYEKSISPVNRIRTALSDKLRRD
jgi:hypothetical protein